MVSNVIFLLCTCSFCMLSSSV